MLNQDIAVRPGALRALVDFAETHPLAGAVGARLEYEDGRFQHSAFRFPDWKQAFFGFFDGLVPLDSEINGRYPSEQLDRAFVAEHLLGACLLLRREAIDQVGAFDPTFFMYYEETDLCVRLTRAGWRNYYLPAARAMHVSAASTSAASEKMSVEFHRSQAIFYRRHRGAGGYALLKLIVWAGIGYRLARSLRAFAARADRRAAAPRADRRLLEDSVVLTGPNGVVAEAVTGTDQLDVSVVIVNYKVRDLLRDCLRSLEHDLGRLRGEVWVVDNASGDGSVEMVRAEFPWVRLIAERAESRLRRGEQPGDPAGPRAGTSWS